jgi:hypothetical protein
MGQRTAKEKVLHDWSKYVTPALASYTVVRVVRKRRPDARDGLQLAAALMLFATQEDHHPTIAPA